MSRYKPALTVIALLALLAVAAPRVETAADLAALAQVQAQSHHVQLEAVSLHSALDRAVEVMDTAWTEAASLLNSWPTLVAKAIALFHNWIASFGPPDLT